MKKSTFYLIPILGLVLIAFTTHAQPNGPAPAPRAAELGLVAVEGEVTLVRAALGRKMAPLVDNKKFEELDQMGNALRASKAQTANGTWHLSCFYHELGDLPETVAAQKYVERLEFLQKWVDAQPKSITARVALARCYMNYAWHARGYGLANTVTPTGWQLFQDRLAEAFKVLVEAKNLEAKCPVWWDIMQFVALGRGWTKNEYNRLFNEAVAYEPDYTFYYNNKVVYLLPRWSGQEGDWQRFAAESADKLGGEAGDILYARIGWRVHERRFYDGFLRDAGYVWPRMEKGLQAIVKSRPDSLTAASELAFLSWQAKDLAVAKPLFEQIGNRVDAEVWGDNAKFLRARAKAAGFNPAGTSGAATGK